MSYPPLWSVEVEARIRAEAGNLDWQEVVPGPIRRCTRCVMTSQRPRIGFDTQGVCSACHYAERKRGAIDWAAREAELRALLDRHRGRRGYNVIVPCSGGKDSASVAWRLKHEYGMRPLCASWAPHIFTDIGARNMQSFIHAGFDVVTAQPNGLVHRKLARLGLEYFGDPFLPFIYGQLCWPMHVARQNGVSLVFFGENGDLEYSGNLEAENQPCYAETDWRRVYMKGAGVDRLLDIGIRLGALSADEVKAISPFYTLPLMDEDAPEFQWFGYYRPWHPQENYYLAAERCGFEANEERSEGTYSRYASLDDKLDGLHYYFGYLKFGIGRCVSDAAHEIRDGDLDREEALALIAKYDGEFPARHLDVCLDYLGMDRAHLDRVIERFKAPHVEIPHRCAARHPEHVPGQDDTLRGRAQDRRSP